MPRPSLHYHGKGYSLQISPSKPHNHVQPNTPIFLTPTNDFFISWILLELNKKEFFTALSLPDIPALRFHHIFHLNPFWIQGLRLTPCPCRIIPLLRVKRLYPRDFRPESFSRHPHFLPWAENQWLYRWSWLLRRRCRQYGVAIERYPAERYQTMNHRNVLWKLHLDRAGDTSQVSRKEDLLVESTIITVNSNSKPRKIVHWWYRCKFHQHLM